MKFNILVIVPILVITICMIIEKYGDNKENNYEEAEVVEYASYEEIDFKQEKKEYPKEDFEDTYKGYKVCAKLEIPIISLNTDILTNYSEKALEVSVVKFWGSNPNENGNFCVVGHNFINKNMFHNLKNLNMGDIFYITDREIGKVEYEIFDIYQVQPEDVSCLDAFTENQKEVTLITCTSDSQRRIIVKGKERIL